MKILVACAAVLIPGCCLVPNSVRPEIEHESHLSQHEPFAEHPTNLGVNIASVMLHWDLPHSYLEIGDGVAISPRTGLGYGDIEGPREEFSARVGIVIPVRR